MMDNWLDDWWSVDYRQQISTVEYVDDTNYSRPPFIPADGHAETQRISEFSHDWCSVVNKLVWSKYVDNSRRRFCLYQLTVTPKRTKQNLSVGIGKSEAEVIDN